MKRRKEELSHKLTAAFLPSISRKLCRRQIGAEMVQFSCAEPLKKGIIVRKNYLFIMGLRFQFLMNNWNVNVI